MIERPPAPSTRTPLHREAATTTVYVVGSARNSTNPELVRRWRDAGIEAALVDVTLASCAIEPGDLAIGRLDVLPTLDGVEDGLGALRRLEDRDVRVLNPARALVTVHDKLRTARALEAAGIPHPTTVRLAFGDSPTPLRPPLVLKPRFGSWGRDVVLCRDARELRRAVAELRTRSWFRRHGALVQELVPPRGHDLRLVLAGGAIVGATERVAAPGEWRTNVSLGGSLRRPAFVPRAARTIASAAASAVGADLVGVDLLPVRGGYVVLELNGAVDFDERYSLPGRDVYADAASALRLPAAEEGAATR